VPSIPVNQRRQFDFVEDPEAHSGAGMRITLKVQPAHPDSSVRPAAPPLGAIGGTMHIAMHKGSARRQQIE